MCYSSKNFMHPGVHFHRTDFYRIIRPHKIYLVPKDAETHSAKYNQEENIIISIIIISVPQSHKIPSPFKKNRSFYIQTPLDVYKRQVVSGDKYFEGLVSSYVDLLVIVRVRKGGKIIL